VKQTRSSGPVQRVDGRSGSIAHFLGGILGERD